VSFTDELRAMFDAAIGPRFEAFEARLVARVVDAVRTADPFLDYDACGELTGKSRDGFRNWVHAPAQAELLRSFSRLGDRSPRVRRSTLVAFIERQKPVAGE